MQAITRKKVLPLIEMNRMLPDTSLVLIATVFAGTGKLGQSSYTGDCVRGSDDVSDHDVKIMKSVKL